MRQRCVDAYIVLLEAVVLCAHLAELLAERLALRREALDVLAQRHHATVERVCFAMLCELCVLQKARYALGGGVATVSSAAVRGVCFGIS